MDRTARANDPSTAPWRLSVSVRCAHDSGPVN
jgi:hypothetical protein